MVNRSDQSSKIVRAVSLAQLASALVLGVSLFGGAADRIGEPLQAGVAPMVDRLVGEPVASGTLAALSVAASVTRSDALTIQLFDADRLFVFAAWLALAVRWCRDRAYRQVLRTLDTLPKLTHKQRFIGSAETQNSTYAEDSQLSRIPGEPE